MATEMAVKPWEEEEEEEEAKWAGQYSSMHEILLVGEGDFSFSLSLATTFGSASNIVATSVDPYDVLVSKYSRAESNLQTLATMGATLIHGIDATKMKMSSDLNTRKFDRVVFNFPHAGFKGKEDNRLLINMHRKLVSGFFRNASHMLRPYGEVHVSHKTSAPFCCWNLEGLASKNSLMLVETVDFKVEDYPLYNNKRGDGRRCDLPFPLGACSTFKFRFFEGSRKKSSRQKISRSSRMDDELPGDGCRQCDSFGRVNFDPPVLRSMIDEPGSGRYPSSGISTVVCNYLIQGALSGYYLQKEIIRRILPISGSSRERSLQGESN